MDFKFSFLNFPFYFFFIPISLIFFTFFIIFFSKNKKPIKAQNLPPSPPGWPIIGNLLQYTGKPYYEVIRELLPKYGPIITLKMGQKKLIIISSPDLAHEALIQKGQIFANRPNENPTRTVFSCNKSTINTAVYGPVWLSLRRNMVQNALTAARLKEFSAVRSRAMDRLIERLRIEAEARNDAVSVLKNARVAFFCILVEMCFGMKMSEEKIEEIGEMMKIVLVTLIPAVDDWFPILSPFFRNRWRNAMDVRKKQIELLVPIIESRRSMLKSDPNQTPFSYLDTLLEMEFEDRRSGSTDVELVTWCSEFINGGTDTTSTAIEWGIARLIENPAIQRKLYDEIRATLRDSRIVDESDVDQMTYLKAFVKELLRKHPPTYVSLQHFVTEDTKLGGYDIPTGCVIEFFLPSIAEDPKYWTDPEKFDPDRFFTGREDADITGVAGVQMISFGAGRRICPGMGMAMVHIHLMIARLVQEFEWECYPEGSKIDFLERCDFTIVMNNPLTAKIQPRVI